MLYEKGDLKIWAVILGYLIVIRTFGSYEEMVTIALTILLFFAYKNHLKREERE